MIGPARLRRDVGEWELAAGWGLVFLESVDGGDGEFGGVEEGEFGALFGVPLVGVAECFGDDALVPDRRAAGLGVCADGVLAVLDDDEVGQFRAAAARSGRRHRMLFAIGSTSIRMSCMGTPRRCFGA